MFKDIIAEHMDKKAQSRCSVSKWIDKLDEEDKDAFIQLRAIVIADSKQINTASLFDSLTNKTQLPFKLTAFRSHMRGYCTCQN